MMVNEKAATGRGTDSLKAHSLIDHPYSPIQQQIGGSLGPSPRFVKVSCIVVWPTNRRSQDERPPFVVDPAGYRASAVNRGVRSCRQAAGCLACFGKPDLLGPAATLHEMGVFFTRPTENTMPTALGRAYQTAARLALGGSLEPTGRCHTKQQSRALRHRAPRRTQATSSDHTRCSPCGLDWLLIRRERDSEAHPFAPAGPPMAATRNPAARSIVAPAAAADDAVRAQ